MEKTTDRETHDFMNVESFSQLPFIRPAPAKDKAPIRLFGIEFNDTSSSADANETQPQDKNKNSNNNSDENSSNSNNNVGDNSNSSNNRKFECHYCCRNFPTSQALGGHQNAHKRERQNAKRANLYGAHFSETYYRLGSTVPPPPPPPVVFHSWNNNNNSTSNSPRYYQGYGNSYSQAHQTATPINGSPLGLWRIPAVQSSSSFSRDHSMMMHHQRPLFASSENLKPAVMVGGSGSGSQGRNPYEGKPSVKDHVSLDLHL